MANSWAHADPTLARFAAVSVASLSDAIDTIVGASGCMVGGIRPIVRGLMIGRATTALLKRAPRDQATREASLRDSVGMIDSSDPGSVGVIAMDQSLDVAGLGGLMAVAAHSRGMSGIVCDGAVRDYQELQSIMLPVYAAALSPAASVTRMVSAGCDIPVTCGGVRVTPGDIIVGGDDGVVVIPARFANEVYEFALDIERRESQMVPKIRAARALKPVADLFKRG